MFCYLVTGVDKDLQAFGQKQNEHSFQTRKRCLYKWEGFNFHHPHANTNLNTLS